MSLNSLLYHKYSLELTSYAAHAPQLKGAVPFIVPSTMDSQNNNGTAQNRVTTVLDCSGCPNFGVGAGRTDTWFQYGGRCCHGLSMCQLQGIVCRLMSIYAHISRGGSSPKSDCCKLGCSRDFSRGSGVMPPGKF